MTDDITTRPDTAPPARRRRWPWITAAVALVLALWMGLATMRLFQARDLALDGLAGLESVRTRVSVNAVSEGGLTSDLRVAAADFASAQGRVRSPLVAPLRLIPWVGTQVRSADALSGSAKQVTEALAETAAEAANLAATAAEKDRVSVAREALAMTRRTQSALDEIDLGPERGLMSSLADARKRFTNELAEADKLLAEVETATAGLEEFLEGPTTYLLLAGNNSEMRAGSGAYLMAGTVRVVDGEVEVGELRPTGDIPIARGAVEVGDEDLAARWGWLDIAVDWRNLSPSPRFPASAELAAAMWLELENEDVDGVIVLDPVALSAIMGETGPVELDGRSIGATDVVRELLFDQYWEEDIDIRRDRLREIAGAALDRMDESGVDLVALAKGLQTAAAARHMLAWSPHPVQQEAWHAVGISGTLEPDSLAVSLLNRGANKLDSFLTVDARLTFAEPGRSVTLSLTLHNQAQAVFPSYVLGPAQTLGQEPGTYVGVLAVNLPVWAREPEFLNVDSLAAVGSDGDSQVIAVWVEIPPGESLEHGLVFSLPAEQTTLRLEASARVPGIVWNAVGVEWVDAADAVVDLDAGTLAGDVAGRSTGEAIFALDPIKNPVAPIPFVAVDGDIETSVVVAWPDLENNPEVDVWERRAGTEWARVGASLTSRPLRLADRTRDTEYCYRTALSALPDRFSAVECLQVPAALGHIRFPGTPDDYFSAPDFVGGGDLDVRVLVAPDQWQPESWWQMFAGQYDAGDRAWRFGIDSFLALTGNFSRDGATDLGTNTFLPVSFRDGTREWVRMTVEPARGIQQFWISEDGIDWTPLGEGRTFEPIDGLHASTRPVYVGTDRPASANSFAGKLYYIEVRDGIDGPIVADLDFRTPLQQDGGPERWIDSHGNQFTANGTGWKYVPPEG